MEDEIQIPDGREFGGCESFLECGDKSPLWNWQTCLPVPKRSQACALQMLCRLYFPADFGNQEVRMKKEEFVRLCSPGT
jgi:hypothetical protein